MCFNISASLEVQLNRAIRLGDQKSICEIRDKFKYLEKLPKFHLSGYTHPEILVYTSEEKVMPRLCYWGLIPHWVKRKQDIPKLWQRTLNARIETIIEKPSYRDSAQEKRCLISINGFFEFHHFNGKSYPFYIYHKENKPMLVAGLWSEWFDRKTNKIISSFTVATTKGKSLLSKIHTNPKLKEARSPLILSEDYVNFWLEKETLNQGDINNMILQHNEENLAAHSVQKLSGKLYLGNVKEVVEEYKYKELVL